MLPTRMMESLKIQDPLGEDLLQGTFRDQSGTRMEVFSLPVIIPGSHNFIVSTTSQHKHSKLFWRDFRMQTSQRRTL
jgi:hypothetical protein